VKGRDRIIILGILLAVGAFTAGWWYLVPHQHPPAGVTLTDLRSVHHLQAMFNADHGTTRLILILSPT
jgi:hypothetical protein